MQQLYKVVSQHLGALRAGKSAISKDNSAASQDTGQLKHAAKQSD